MLKKVNSWMKSWKVGLIAVFACSMLLGLNAWGKNPALPFPGASAACTPVVTDVTGYMINGIISADEKEQER